MINLIFQVYHKNVYGNTLVYPHNETARQFAALIGCKTFNAVQLRQIALMGYQIERVFGDE